MTSPSIEIRPITLSAHDAGRVRARRTSMLATFFALAGRAVRWLRGGGQDATPPEPPDDSAGQEIVIRDAILYCSDPFNEECPTIGFASSDTVVVIIGQCLYDPWANATADLLSDEIDFGTTYFNNITIVRARDEGHLMSLTTSSAQTARVTRIKLDDFPIGPGEVQVLIGPGARSVLDLLESLQVIPARLF